MQDAVAPEELEAPEDVFAPGRVLRKSVPRSDHGAAPERRRDVDSVSILEKSNEGRLDDLIPVRHDRMKDSAFTYFRGAPAVMAADLADTPVTGVLVQACGDCHLENFGVFATPERNVIFDINDFDETLRAPWEWDVKRLAASVHIAGRTTGLTEIQCSKAARAAARGYRERMRECATMSALEIWYSRIDAQTVVEQTQNSALRRKALGTGEPAPNHTHEIVAGDYTVGEGRDRRIADKPPKLFHSPPDREVVEDAEQVWERYRETLRDDVHALLEQYRLMDMAVKVVGIGSVGTRCAVALFMAKNDDPLLLQIKEARPSVLEEFAEKTPHSNHGQRVVTGQRLMQAASDMFLGWSRSVDGHDFYVRQLSDMKGSANVADMNAAELATYANLCGTVLAIAHARSGQASAIAGYLGKASTFDRAVAEFAASYADQNERDYRSFLEALSSGRLASSPE
jgi:uncharacterized protein (DUF2252 family)